jgi:hypothetical protein
MRTKEKGVVANNSVAASRSNLKAPRFAQTAANVSDVLTLRRMPE